MSGAKHKRPVAPRGQKGNPWLNQIAAAYEAQEMQDLRYQAEIDRMAVMRLLREKFQVGPGRAADLMNEYMEIKNSIPESLLEDTKDDPEALVYKRNWAYYLRDIFGPEKWKSFREYFQYLKEYW